MRKDHIDRRKYSRHTVSLPCRVDGVASSATMQVADLSVGGCFIATREPVPEGSAVTVHAKFAGVELALGGSVVHVRPGRGFAIEFVNLASDTRYLLEQFLTRVPVSNY